MTGASIRRLSGAALSALTLGRDEQSFLDARWIAALLRRAPAPSARRLALSILSWSPHYFYRRAEHQGLSHVEFIEREFARNRATREQIGELLLGPHLHAHQIVLDYGCGPGFLARYVAGRVRTVYGVDISRGALECARVINDCPNVSYLHAADIAAIDDATVDLAYSVAVAQHLTDRVLASVLATIRAKLKPAGRLVLHIVLDVEGWRTEQEWRSDVSLTGRLKLRYGLNCFTRSEQRVRDIVKTAGFESIVFRPIRDICPVPFDDVCTQHLVCASA